MTEEHFQIKTMRTTEAMRAIEKLFLNSLERWQRGRDPFFVITGWPGLGKSTLLRYLKEKCEREGHQSYCTDLDRRKRDNDRYWQYISQDIRNLGNNGNGPPCFFFDHIPSYADRAIDGIDEQIIRKHRGQAFMVFALIDRRQWGLATIRFVDGVSLAPFTPEEIAALLSEDRAQLTEETFNELCELGHPGLALLIAREGREAGCRLFLDHWLKRVEVTALQDVLYSSRLYELAERHEEISEMAVQEVGLPRKIIDELSSAGWIGWSLDDSEDEENPDLWVPPVRYCLRVLGGTIDHR